MSVCAEKQNENPSSKKLTTMNTSYQMEEGNPASLQNVEEWTGQSEMTGAALVENSDTISAPISASSSKDSGDAEVLSEASSGDDSDLKSRKRRFSKRSNSFVDILVETREILVEPSAPLPDVDENISPDDFLLKLLDAQLGCKLEPKKALDIKNFFHKSTEAEVAAYTTEVVTAVRDEDLDLLRKMQENGQDWNCFNRFGESLLNLACRRGFESIVRYLMDQPGVTIKTSDDCGRTILHDACWHPQPQLKICKWILEKEPALFFIMDRRGCTAFQYARPEHWPVWRKFLLDNRQNFDALKDPFVMSMLAKASQ